jgi:N-acetylglucosamine kinase-like BadF-type ATPase
MSRYLGVDGGGTKTAAWVVGPEGLLGAGLSGPGAWSVPDLADHVRAAVEAALAAAGLGFDAIDHAVLGLSGADFPEDYADLQQRVAPVMDGVPFRIVNDTEVALVGGARKPWGVVSICGSGTNCLGRFPDGRSFTIGGMGYDGDFGGGHDLVRTAVARAFQADQGRGPRTVLRDVVLALLGFDDYGRLSRAIHLNASAVFTPERRAALIRAVFEAAAQDPVAQDLLVQMGSALGQTAGAAARRLLADPAVRQAGPVEVVMAGSVWRGPHPLMVDAFRLGVHRYATAVDIHHAVRDPVAGAALLAVADGGGPVEQIRERLPAAAD